MKTNRNLRGLMLLTAMVALGSCSNLQTRELTERIIKNDIELHKAKEFSTIKTLSIYRGTTVDELKYVELTGIKYLGNKYLLIGAETNKSKVNKDNSVLFLVDSTFNVPNYVILTQDEALSIVENYKELQAKIKAEKPMRSEEIYYDYTVTDNLFISFRKARSGTSSNRLDIWINRQKYSIVVNDFVKTLEKFNEY